MNTPNLSPPAAIETDAVRAQRYEAMVQRVIALEADRERLRKLANDVVNELVVVYNMAKDGRPIEITLGQFRRLNHAQGILSGLEYSQP